MNHPQGSNRPCSLQNKNRQNAPACLAINHWSEDDRPREKLERLGASSLSNAELLITLIGPGSTDGSAADLVKCLLSSYNNDLNSLGKLSIHDLTRYKGIGPTKAVTILAAYELAKRKAMERAEEWQGLGSAAATYDYMHPRMQDLDAEEA